MSTPPDALSRVRPLSELPALAQRAAELLVTPQTRLPLTPTEAAHVVAQMGVVQFPPGATLIREGDEQRTGHLLLLLEGEVQVDTGEVPISVLGVGNIIGEMSLIDGAPRSAQCTALGPVLAAGLSRRGLEQLIEEQPRAAAKLVTGLAQRLADRLRALGQQVQMLRQIGPP